MSFWTRDARKAGGRLRPSPCRYSRARRTRAARSNPFVAGELDAGRRVLLVGLGESLNALKRRLRRRAGKAIEQIDGWADLPDAELVAREAPLDAGAALPSLNLTLVAAADYLGSRTQSLGRDATNRAC